MAVQIIRSGERADYTKIQRESWSRLRHLAKSPRHYLWATEHDKASTPSQALGDATHVLTLEPSRFDERFAIWTGARRAGKEWEAFAEAAKAARKTVLTEDDHETALSLAASVRAEPTAAQLLAKGDAEVSVLWEALGLPLKSRLDFVGSAVVELKTTRDASLEGFGREVWKYRYHAQLAMYRDAWEAATGERLPCVVIAVESEAPHVTQVFRLGEVELFSGQSEYRGLIEQLQLCRASNSWSGYAAGAVDLVLPRWAQYEMEAANNG